MTQPKKHAVLLAAHNGQKYINQQIDSILAQRNVTLDLFISVDKSKDKTLDIVNEYTCKYENCKLGNHYTKKSSAAANFFRLILDTDLSYYDYVSYADQDDIWIPTKLIDAECAINEMGVSAISSDVVAFDANGKLTYIKKSYTMKRFDHLFESPGPGCTFTIKSNALQNFKDFISNLSHDTLSSVKFHDWFTYLYLREKNYQWAILSKPLIFYRQHMNNVFGARLGWVAIFNRLKLLIKGGFIEQSYIQTMLTHSSNQMAAKVMLKAFIMNPFSIRRKRTDNLVLLAFSPIIIFYILYFHFQNLWKNKC